MMNQYEMICYDPGPYGGWFSFDQTFFAVDEQSAMAMAKEEGWGPKIKMELY